MYTIRTFYPSPQPTQPSAKARKRSPNTDRRTLGRFSFLIPFWVLSIGFLRVARYSPLASWTGLGVISAASWELALRGGLAPIPHDLSMAWHFTGQFTLVPAKHSKSFSLLDAISADMDRMQRKLEPMRKQVELWRQSELTALTP